MEPRFAGRIRVIRVAALTKPPLGRFDDGSTHVENRRMFIAAAPISEAFRIRRPKLAGPGDHYGLFASRYQPPFGWQRGYLNSFYQGLATEVVYELTVGGFRAVSLQEFLQGHDLQVVGEAATREDLQAIEQRVEALSVGRVDYGFFQRNCEHAANWLFSGERVSRQINGLVGIAALVGVVLVAGRG